MPPDTYLSSIHDVPILYATNHLRLSYDVKSSEWRRISMSDRHWRKRILPSGTKCHVFCWMSTNAVSVLRVQGTSCKKQTAKHYLPPALLWSLFWLTFWTWGWRNYISPWVRLTVMRLYDVESQTRELFLVTAVRTSWRNSRTAHKLRVVLRYGRSMVWEN